MKNDLPLEGDRRSGRDRREAFVDAISYGRLVSELVKAENELLVFDGLELVGDSPATGGPREAFVAIAGRAEGLARALAIVAGDDQDLIRGRARELAREGRAVHDGMSSIGSRSERALEELVAAEESELCPSCGGPISEPPKLIGFGPGRCELAEEHEVDELELDVLKRSTMSLEDLETIHGERAPGA